MKKLLLLLFALVITSCGGTVTNGTFSTVQQKEKEAIVATKYPIQGGYNNYCVHKFVIEGHEYLLFGGNLATSPTVLHSESCPCRNKD